MLSCIASFGDRLLVQDTLTQNGKLTITDLKSEVKEIAKISDGRELDCINWFDWSLWGRAIAIDPWYTQYERSWEEVYLTGEQVDGEYKTRLPYKTTDNDLIREIYYILEDFPFMKIETNNRWRLWAKSVLTTEWLVETIPDLTTTEWETIESVDNKRYDDMPYLKVKLARHHKSHWISNIDDKGVCLTLRTPHWNIVNEITEMQIPWVFRIEADNEIYFMKMKLWKMVPFSGIDSSILGEILKDHIKYSTNFYINKTTGKIMPQKNV